MARKVPGGTRTPTADVLDLRGIQPDVPAGNPAQDHRGSASGNRADGVLGGSGRKKTWQNLVKSHLIVTTSWYNILYTYCGFGARRRQVLELCSLTSWLCLYEESVGYMEQRAMHARIKKPTWRLIYRAKCCGARTCNSAMNQKWLIQGLIHGLTSIAFFLNLVVTMV